MTQSGYEPKLGSTAVSSGKIKGILSPDIPRLLSRTSPSLVLSPSAFLGYSFFPLFAAISA